jgi:hypothetical protein
LEIYQDDISRVDILGDVIRQVDFLEDDFPIVIKTII